MQEVSLSFDFLHIIQFLFLEIFFYTGIEFIYLLVTGETNGKLLAVMYLKNFLYFLSVMFKGYFVYSDVILRYFIV